MTDQNSMNSDHDSRSSVKTEKSSDKVSVAEIYMSNEVVPFDIQEIAQALGESYDLDYELGKGHILVSREE